MTARAARFATTIKRDCQATSAATGLGENPLVAAAEKGGIDSCA
jgi:hypothetical protein